MGFFVFSISTKSFNFSQPVRRKFGTYFNSHRIGPELHRNILNINEFIKLPHPEIGLHELTRKQNENTTEDCSKVKI